jgi:dienelactone hydrolase
LELARSGAEVAGVVSFHGGLDSPNPADGKNIKTPVLILHGAADPHVKQEDIVAMKQEFVDAAVEWTFAEFSGALHAFTDKSANRPAMGAAYDKRADKESWRIFKGYLKQWTK